MACTATSRDNKEGWFDVHGRHLHLAANSHADVILIGDSIIAGLSRYTGLWKKYFYSLTALNLGIAGDRTQHVLWRAECLQLNDRAKYIVIHCGTNNIDRDPPKDIALAVASIGFQLQKSRPYLKIILTGLLPRDKNSGSLRREKIARVNHYLKKICNSKEMKNFVFMKQDSDWVLEDGTLDDTLYYSDSLHLIEAGNEKLATSITNTLARIKTAVAESSSERSSSSRDENLTAQLQCRKRKFSADLLSHSKRRKASVMPTSLFSWSKEMESSKKWNSARKWNKLVNHTNSLGVPKSSEEVEQLKNVACSIDISKLNEEKRREARIAKFNNVKKQPTESECEQKSKVLVRLIKSSVEAARTGLSLHKNRLSSCGNGGGSYEKREICSAVSHCRSGSETE